MKTDIKTDIIIIGGGIAGMTAAIYAARSNFKAVIVERDICGGLVNSTYVIENFPSQKSINGLVLMEKVQEQVLCLGVEVEQVAEIEKWDLESEIKSIETDESIYRGPAVILATGSDPIRLPHLADCEQVHYCAICDGPAYKGKHVFVVGGGNSGFDETLYLLSLGVKSVTIVEVMEQCMAEGILQDQVLANNNVEVLVQTQIKEALTSDGKLTSVLLENTATSATAEKEAQSIFVFIGQKPNTDSFKDAVKLTDRGYIIADRDMQTNLPGVFAAGDVVDKRYRQIPTAMSDGAIAALTAGAYLRSRNTRVD
jgi:thioredoxin reductase (NADPH)